MKDNQVGDLMGLTIQKIKEMADANTVIGEPIREGDVTMIPISKVSYGFASGGSDFPSKSNAELFGGGGGAGISITPISFIVIHGSDVRMLHVDTNDSTAEKLVTMIPEILDKISDFIEKNKKKKQEEKENGQVE